MEIIFKSDGTAEDLAKILQLLQRMTHNHCPEAPVFVTTPTMSTTTAISTLEDIEAQPQEHAKPVEPQKPDKTKAKKKREHKRQMARDVDPFELIKQGWYYKGTYAYDKGLPSEHKRITLGDPKNSKHNFTWRIGDGVKQKGVDEATAKRIIEEASKNRKPRLGRHKTVKPSRQQDSNTAPAPAAPEPPRPSPPAAQKETACQLCLNRGRPLGNCEKMGSAHCKICHDISHGDMLYPFKPI